MKRLELKAYKLVKGQDSTVSLVHILLMEGPMNWDGLNSYISTGSFSIQTVTGLVRRGLARWDRHPGGDRLTLNAVPNG